MSMNKSDNPTLYEISQLRKDWGLAGEEDTHLVVELDAESYWETGEGTVEYVKERDDGSVTVGMTPISGPQHTQRLKIPADGRKKQRFSGVARGANNLGVEKVYER